MLADILLGAVCIVLASLFIWWLAAQFAVPTPNEPHTHWVSNRQPNYDYVVADAWEIYEVGTGSAVCTVTNKVQAFELAAGWTDNDKHAGIAYAVRPAKTEDYPNG